MSSLTNQEKSSRRYESLTKLAELFADKDDDFKTFCYNNKEEKYEITWRKWETYLKNKFEAGARISTVIESSVSGD